MISLEYGRCSSSLSNLYALVGQSSYSSSRGMLYEVLNRLSIFRPSQRLYRLSCKVNFSGNFSLAGLLQHHHLRSFLVYRYKSHLHAIVITKALLVRLVSFFFRFIPCFAFAFSIFTHKQAFSAVSAFKC